MCSAAHGWVGLGRIVYAVSSAQLGAWRSAWGAPASPVAPLSIREVVPGAVVDGPAPQLEDEVRDLHRRFAHRHPTPDPARPAQIARTQPGRQPHRQPTRQLSPGAARRPKPHPPPANPAPAQLTAPRRPANPARQLRPRAQPRPEPSRHSTPRQPANSPETCGRTRDSTVVSGPPSDHGRADRESQRATQSSPPRIRASTDQARAPVHGRRTLKRAVDVGVRAPALPPRSSSVASTSRRTSPVSPTLLAEAALLDRHRRQPSFPTTSQPRTCGAGLVPHHPDVHVTYPGVRASGAPASSAHRRKAAQEVVDRACGVTGDQRPADLPRPVPRARPRRPRRPRRLPRPAEALHGPRAAARFVAGVEGPIPGGRGGQRPWCVRAWTPPMETRLRLLIVLAGLPEPEVDHRVHDARTATSCGASTSPTSPTGSIIEYDGRQHAESDEQWLSDIASGRAARRLSGSVASSSWLGTSTARPATTLSAHHARAMRASRHGGARALGDEWRRHFPGRPGDASRPA